MADARRFLNSIPRSSAPGDRLPSADAASNDRLPWSATATDVPTSDGYAAATIRSAEWLHAASGEPI